MWRAYIVTPSVPSVLPGNTMAPPVAGSKWCDLLHIYLPARSHWPFNAVPYQISACVFVLTRESDFPMLNLIQEWKRRLLAGSSFSSGGDAKLKLPACSAENAADLILALLNMLLSVLSETQQYEEVASWVLLHHVKTQPLYSYPVEWWLPAWHCSRSLLLGGSCIRFPTLAPALLKWRFLLPCRAPFFSLCLLPFL